MKLRAEAILFEEWRRTAVIHAVLYDAHRGKDQPSSNQLPPRYFNPYAKDADE